MVTVLLKPEESRLFAEVAGELSFARRPGGIGEGGRTYLLSLLDRARSVLAPRRLRAIVPAVPSGISESELAEIESCEIELGLYKPRARSAEPRVNDTAGLLRKLGTDK